MREGRGACDSRAYGWWETLAVAVMPETRYVLAPEGHHLAYQVVGEGARDILLVAEGRTPIDLIWDDPLAAHALRRLAGVGRLILCDLRGWGSSDAVPSRDLPAMQAWTDDILAVLDAADSERSALVANSEFCLPAMLFAATHPQRVSALALINPFARYLRGPETAWGLPEDRTESYVDVYRQQTGTGTLADRLAPSRAGDESFRRWYARSERLGAGPGDAAAIFRVFMRTDITSTLSSIQAPTLLLRRRGDRHVRDGHARLIAQEIPDARLVELDGQDNVWCSGDVDALMDETERFITGARTSAAGARVLATVMFTDIAASTDRASALGDAKWTELLQAHDELVRAHVGAFHGRLVKSIGDGTLVMFDGPARGIYCALGLCQAVRALGLELRAGLHTGEVELLGEDIGGIAVHLAARVAALAGPGEVLVSSATPPLTVGSGLRFTSRGIHALKGIPEKWELFAAAERRDSPRAE